jgi:hypothetical protein
MINRLALRILKLKAHRSHNHRAEEAIEKILKDRELLQIFNEYLNSEFFGSPLDLLDWLIKNWEQVLEAILKLIDLFSED